MNIKDDDEEIINIGFGYQEEKREQPNQNTNKEKK